MFTATISRSDAHGEIVYQACVRFAGRQVFAWSGPTENYVQCEVLDWARRTGKTEQLNWEYPMNASSRTLQRFASQGVAAQAAIDQLVQPPLKSEALLNLQESKALAGLEEQIARGLDTFIEVGEALCEIRDSRLYRERYRSFEDYCRQRWGMTGRHAHRLVDSAQIAHNLLPPAPLAEAGDDAGLTNWSAPKNESQVRPLKGLEPAEQQEVWREAVRSAPGDQVTARDVQETRERLHPKPKSEQRREVEVELWRVESGGDIDRANCHELLAGNPLGGEPVKLKEAFVFEKELWVVSLGHYGGTPGNPIITQEAHRLISDNSMYGGPEDGEFFAEGRTVLWKGSRMRLGPMVLFRGVDEEGPAEEISRTVMVDMSRVDGGDIARANSAGPLGEGKGPYEIRRPFEFEGKLWCVTGSLYGRHVDGKIDHEGHELIPERLYAGPERRKFSYQGELVVWKKERYRLGPLVLFRAKEKQAPLKLEVETSSKPASGRERLLLDVDQLIKNCSALRVLANEELSGKLSTKELLHLSVALTHLKNFRNSVDQAGKPKYSTEEYSNSGNQKARKDAIKAALADRWKAAKASAKPKKKPKAEPDSTLFVVCRKTQGGAITFLTAGHGWTNHANNARTFPTATAAKFACNHSYDKPMMFHRAVGLRP